MIHDNYNRLTVTERAFVDETSWQIMRSFESATFLPYKLLGDDRAETFVEAFATWLTESAKDRGLVRQATGIKEGSPVFYEGLRPDDEIIWTLEVR